MVFSDEINANEISSKIQTSNQLLQQAITTAIEVSKLAYAPFSNFPVGCTIISHDHSLIVKSCNVENASYGLTLCAERNGICRAIADGLTGRDMNVIVVYARDGWGMPCGACRQFMVEMNPEMLVVVVSPQDPEKCRYTKASNLLPYAFNL